MRTFLQLQQRAPLATDASLLLSSTRTLVSDYSREIRRQTHRTERVRQTSNKLEQGKLHMQASAVPQGLVGATGRVKHDAHLRRRTVSAE